MNKEKHLGQASGLELEFSASLYSKNSHNIKTTDWHVNNRYVFGQLGQNIRQVLWGVSGMQKKEQGHGGHNPPHNLQDFEIL